jgi:cysteinyl-tRNA synthetase
MAMQYLGNSFDLHAGGEDLMFPHHENEIAQSESATHETFARHWFHVRFLLVEGRKMSKSSGNFYTLRDLLLKGYKASAIRSLLISVPYGQQLNFTFEGLAAETAAVERLRAFALRVKEGPWPAETDAGLLEETSAATEEFNASLRRDLNTAEARAAIFDLVRKANAAADEGVLGGCNAEAILVLLARFDSVFQVLGDRDAEVTGAALDWAEREGRLDQAPAELLAQRALSDAQIEALIQERNHVRRSRNFARSDAIRDELLSKGIVIEDSKDGARWRRK